MCSTFGVSSHARKPFRNSSLSYCFLTTAPFSPTRRKLYSTSSTASLMQPRTSASHQPEEDTCCTNSLHEKRTVLFRSASMAQASTPHFTYLGSVISNDATVSKDLDNCLSISISSSRRLSKRVWQSFAPPLHEDPGVKSRRCSHPPVRCGDLGSLSEADQATRAGSLMLLALRPWH